MFCMTLIPAKEAHAHYKVQIKPVRLQSLCLDVANGRVFSGSDVQVAECKYKGHPAQTWVQGKSLPGYERGGEGASINQIRLASDPSFCLDYEYSTSLPKVNVGLQIWKCSDKRNGDSAYWARVLGYGSQAFSFKPFIPNFGGSRLSMSITTKAKEGERLRMRDFSQENVFRNNYQMWITERI